ncbi:hypothetical protein SCHPADRAFT_171417 [Schizopora paradoxa]|uniref:Uncharacterized protein n=1 Tax=Schizopora paradoxa TaxID=27342 RepID=A0A0H2S6H7_9AGAM|nr:hypothetical protein SCHPADRAFT_171417 [Schizopora paradoxa]
MTLFSPPAFYRNEGSHQLRTHLSLFRPPGRSPHESKARYNERTSSRMLDAVRSVPPDRQRCAPWRTKISSDAYGTLETLFGHVCQARRHAFCLVLLNSGTSLDVLLDRSPPVTFLEAHYPIHTGLAQATPFMCHVNLGTRRSFSPRVYETLCFVHFDVRGETSIESHFIVSRSSVSPLFEGGT